MNATLILYACPTGALGAQLDAYYARSRDAIGPNAAHGYMPHCTLTGFFRDEPGAIPRYIQALESALAGLLPEKPARPVTITGMVLTERFHGLTIESPWLENLAAAFVHQAHSPTRSEPLRLKNWLHVSLGYEFAPEQHAPLSQLARDMVDLHAQVGWELRLYQRHPEGSWTAHWSHPIQ